MTYFDLLKEVWETVFDPKTDTTKAIEKFFHKDYEQCINGVVLNRAEYIDHVLAQKQNILIDSFDYKYALEQGNKLFTIYYPRGKNINNLPIEGEVIAYFHFEDQQIWRIHGQVRLLQGDLADVDMKSS